MAGLGGGRGQGNAAMRILAFIGFIWALPMSVLSWLLLLFLAITRQVVYVKCNKYFVFDARINKDGYFFKHFFSRRGFVGFSLGNTIFLPNFDLVAFSTIVHETEHVYQYYVFGILFLPCYFINSICIYFFKKDKHSYYDNWFEVSARKKAGQVINISKEQWPGGPDRRWIFW